MSTSQVLILIFCTIVIVLAIWNLVLALQNLKIQDKIEEYNKKQKEKREMEAKADYYGRLK
jgi:cell division protein FtsL